jgi:hypothetical protein
LRKSFNDNNLVFQTVEDGEAIKLDNLADDLHAKLVTMKLSGQITSTTVAPATIYSFSIFSRTRCTGIRSLPVGFLLR